ncbi:MAG TPA: hypothetical protein VFS15_03625 [Kofleriaceae bacterium]|nr:hypothetical protein [Kofleriaceae bacterium]
MCHRPGGPAQGDLDLRIDTPLADTNACDRAPAFGDLELDDARVIAPGAPGRSVLLARMGTRGDDQMPPLGTFEVDTVATATIAEWIASLTSCQ